MPAWRATMRLPKPTMVVRVRQDDGFARTLRGALGGSPGGLKGTIHQMNTVVDGHAHKQGDDDQVGDVHLHVKERHQGNIQSAATPRGRSANSVGDEAPKVQAGQDNDRQHGIHPTPHIALLHIPDRIERHDRGTSDAGINRLKLAYEGPAWAHVPKCCHAQRSARDSDHSCPHSARGDSPVCRPGSLAQADVTLLLQQSEFGSKISHKGPLESLEGLARTLRRQRPETLLHRHQSCTCCVERYLGGTVFAGPSRWVDAAI